MLIMFDAGLRRSECVDLQPRHIIPPQEGAELGQIRVVKGKGDKDRLVPLTKRLSQALAEYQFVEGMGPKDFFWYTRPAARRFDGRSRPARLRSTLAGNAA
jgi:site-specific recombinase XerC